MLYMGYFLLAFITMVYAATFHSFGRSLHDDPGTLATIRIACGAIYLLFCGLFVWLWLDERPFIGLVGALAALVLVVTMFCVRPLLRVPENH